MKKFKIILIIQTVILLALLTQAIGFTWSREEVFSECQPNSISYASYDPYCVRIFDTTKTFGKKREIWITKSIDHTYGYKIEYPEAYRAGDKKAATNTSITWDSDRILLSTYNLEISIPKEKFIGGR